MKRTTLALAIMLGVSLAATALGNGFGTGVVTGKVIFDGGPGPRVIGGDVGVYNLAGERVRPIEHVAAGESYRFRLAPGRYLLNTGTRLHYKWPHGCPAVSARVRLGQTTALNVDNGCGIP